LGCWRRKVKATDYSELSQVMLKVVLACDAEGSSALGMPPLVQCVELQLRVERSKMQMEHQDVPLEKGTPGTRLVP